MYVYLCCALTFPHRRGKMHFDWPACPCLRLSRATQLECSDWSHLHLAGLQNADTAEILSPS